MSSSVVAFQHSVKHDALNTVERDSPERTPVPARVPRPLWRAAAVARIVGRTSPHLSRKASPMKRLVLLLTLAAAPLAAQDVSIPHTTFTLPTGLRVIVAEDHSTPVATVDV